MDICATSAAVAEYRAFLDTEVGTGPEMGGRVRIRADLGQRCPDSAHDAAESGHTGTIVNVRRASRAASHTYLVRFDDPQPVMRVADRRMSLPARHYAGIELEPAD
jgi:hypothetical protein